MGDLVTAATILVGSGATGWLADKLLGPSFEGLGGQFKAFASDRLTSIFGKAEEKVDRDQIEALPPGFALMFVQNASFSDPDERVTALWAGLLADASKGTDSRHSVYVDILSQIGPDEAGILKSIWEALPSTHQFGAQHGEETVKWRMRKSKAIKTCNSQTSFEVIDEIETIFADAGVPLATVEINFRGKHGGGVSRHSSEVSLPCQILERQNLLRKVDYDVEASATGPQAIAHGYFLTDLGWQFLATCEGEIDAIG